MATAAEKAAAAKSALVQPTTGNDAQKKRKSALEEWREGTAEVKDAKKVCRIKAQLVNATVNITQLAHP
jgi:hypothetical protein